MIISIINQKGGVAKTTTTFNLASNLAEANFKVLQIDIDPQASLTIVNGLEPDQYDKTIYNVLCDGLDIRECIYNIDDNLDICIANLDLSASDLILVNKMARENLLNKALKNVSEKYDFILIDCPPNLGLLTVNALCASNKILIPSSTDYLSLRGLNLLIDTVNQIKLNLNEKLEILGLVATMHDVITRHSREVLELYKKNFTVLAVISSSVKIKDSNLASSPLNKFEPNHKTAEEYKLLSKKVIEIMEKEQNNE